MKWGTSETVAAVSALIPAGSACFGYMGYKTAWAGHKRNIIVQGQILLLDANKMLMADPLLWTILDDHPLASDPTLQDKRNSPEFKAKLQTFIDIVANMFDMMLAELPHPRPRGDNGNPRFR